jgi:hypothetical protein
LRRSCAGARSLGEDRPQAGEVDEWLSARCFDPGKPGPWARLLSDDRWRPVASLESLMALGSRSAGTVEGGLLVPIRAFAFHPIAVAERFEPGEEWRLELARIASDRGARLHQGALAEVDAAAMIVPALELAGGHAAERHTRRRARAFDADEDVAGPLPTARQAKPEESTQQRARAHR